ncbi:MAG: hypothetical protein HYV09_40290 [Deltaproteobacteria bacterium]|nr:hypothetical protein [Deltaproteobacteria bacterium]
MHAAIRWVPLAALLAAAPMGAASAAPKPAEPFPLFIARDVAGQKQSTATFRGAPTLVLAITDRGAGDAMRAWFEGAQKRAPTVRLKGLISIDVPSFVSDDFVRARARETIPKTRWHDNLLDTHLGIAQVLSLPESDVPWAFVLDAQGRIVAAAHAKADAQAASAVWKSLEAVM